MLLTPQRVARVLPCLFGAILGSATPALADYRVTNSAGCDLVIAVGTCQSVHSQFRYTLEGAEGMKGYERERTVKEGDLRAFYPFTIPSRGTVVISQPPPPYSARLPIFVLQVAGTSHELLVKPTLDESHHLAVETLVDATPPRDQPQPFQLTRKADNHLELESVEGVPVEPAPVRACCVIL